MRVPDEVVAALAGDRDATLLCCTAEPVRGGTGAATGTVRRLTVRCTAGTGTRSFRMIAKQARPATGGRHAAGATDPRHFAYWRREPLAYASGLLPAGPGLAAPRCVGVVDDTVYLAEVTGPPESPRRAARRLARWQTTAPVPDVPWLAGHQLAQRLAVTNLDWYGLDVDRRLLDCWARRDELLAALRSVPTVLSHGDFHRGNLIAAGDRTVVLDWATLGANPLGADLAHLALGTRTDPVPDYLAAAGDRVDAAAVRLGYRVTLALTGISRLHWMLSRGIAPAAGYVDFLLAHLPVPANRTAPGGRG